MSDISDRILALMREKDISYGELSTMTGIPKSALQRYATGTTPKIPLDRIEDIATALVTTAAYLLGWTNDPLDYNAMDFDVPSDFEGEVKDYYEFLKARDEDVARERNEVDDDIRAIQRAANKMDSKKRQKMMDLLKISFEEEFGEDE